MSGNDSWRDLDKERDALGGQVFDVRVVLYPVAEYALDYERIKDLKIF